MAQATLSISSLPEFDNHELVSYLYDENSGLRGFIAIHSTKLGPATGGTRYWRYKAESEALRDALRLSKAMSYKCALAGVPFGGGKGAIIADPSQPKKKALLAAYAKKVNLLDGNFITGEDVGLDAKDVEILSQISPYIIGSPKKAGDPSPWAAKSVFYAIKSGLEFSFGNPTIKGRKFAIKGLGKVGFELAKLLTKEGGQIVAADINEKARQKAKKLLPNIQFVSPDQIHRQAVDVFAPCALGNELDKQNISQLNCKIVCGSANNQLASSEAGTWLYQRDILYIPDYVANAGGLINVTDELNPGGYSPSRVEKKIQKLNAIIKKILSLSLKKDQPTSQIADKLAEKILNS